MTNSNDQTTDVPGNQPEPLLPVERKLIGWSFGIGVVLLIVLAIVNHLFPAHL